MPDPLYIVLWFIVFLFSLSVHESAHAFVSDRFGDDTGRMLGRISLNPIVHIDIFGTIIFPLVGMITGFGFGWAKPVPVNPLNWREKDKANFWVSAAGPLSNFALALIAFTVLKTLILSGVVDLTEPPTSFWNPIIQLLYIGVTLNVVLGVFNLLPIPPLDGSGVLESMLPDEAQRGFEQLKPYGMILLLALMLSGVLRYIINPVIAIIQRLL